jgi:hypothetical protein
MNEIACPFRKCRGLLVWTSTYKTDMGYEVLDENKHSELFRCNRCGREVTREWSWRQRGPETR